MSTPLTAQNALRSLRALATEERRVSNIRFFRTGKGEYGEGDRFLGVTVPDTRKVAQVYASLSYTEIAILLTSPLHEARLLALIILVGQFRHASQKERATITRFYLAHKEFVNNWDLVDTSASNILGEELRTTGKGMAPLQRLAQSSSLWDRRIAIVATLAFTLKGDTGPAFTIAKRLLKDKEDLIHKAVGWMLREAGKIDRTRLDDFLEVHAGVMPRTTLRYAIERHSEAERKYFLAFSR